MEQVTLQSTMENEDSPKPDTTNSQSELHDSSHDVVKKKIDDYVSSVIDSASSSFVASNDYSLFNDEKDIEKEPIDTKQTSEAGSYHQSTVGGNEAEITSAGAEGNNDSTATANNDDSHVSDSSTNTVIRSSIVREYTDVSGDTLSQLHGKVDVYGESACDKSATGAEDAQLTSPSSETLKSELKIDHSLPEEVGDAHSIQAEAVVGSELSSSWHLPDQVASLAGDSNSYVIVDRNIQSNDAPARKVSEAKQPDSTADADGDVNTDVLASASSSVAQSAPVNSEEAGSELHDENIGDASEGNQMLEQVAKPGNSENVGEAGEHLDSVNQEEETEKGWMDVLGNGLLKKKIIISGEGKDTRPKRLDEVTVNVESRLGDGSLAEGMRQLTFVLGDQETVNALDLAVNLMEKGETCTVISDAKYCYGKAGKPPNIPCDAQLTYTITLVDIQDGPFKVSTPIKKRLGWVDRKRYQGNKLYAEKKFTEAAAAYKKCTTVLQQASNQDHDEDIQADVKSRSLKCYNNLAATHMMSEEWKDALKACQNAERLDQANIRTLFRKGKIMAKLGEFGQAIEALKKASDLDPHDKAIQTELAKCMKKLQVQKESQKRLYKRMFWENKDTSKKEETPSPSTSSWWPSRNMLMGSSLMALGAILVGTYFLHR